MSLSCKKITREGNYTRKRRAWMCTHSRVSFLKKEHCFQLHISTHRRPYVYHSIVSKKYLHELRKPCAKTTTGRCSTSSNLWTLHMTYIHTSKPNATTGLSCNLPRATVNIICILSVDRCSYPEQLSVRGRAGSHRLHKCAVRSI